MVNGEIALVTGAARGIGAETARHLATAGYQLVVNYRSDASAAEAVVASIAEAGGQAAAVQADISLDEDVQGLFRYIDEMPGTLRALVNNAGILGPQCSVLDLTAERIEQIFRTNVTGSFLCCREAVQRMSTSRGGVGGAIVNVSSMAALLGSPNEYVDYAASKAAVDTLTRGLALEVADQGIRVNAVRPGLIYTDMHASGGEPGRVDRLKSTVPMGRGGEVAEVAAAIAWLLSDEASFTTGSFIDVSGGR